MAKLCALALLSIGHLVSGHYGPSFGFGRRIPQSYSANLGSIQQNASDPNQCKWLSSSDFCQKSNVSQCRRGEPRDFKYFTFTGTGNVNFRIDRIGNRMFEFLLETFVPRYASRSPKRSIKLISLGPFGTIMLKNLHREILRSASRRFHKPQMTVFYHNPFNPNVYGAYKVAVDMGKKRALIDHEGGNMAINSTEPYKFKSRMYAKPVMKDPTRESFSQEDMFNPGFTFNLKGEAEFNGKRASYSGAWNVQVGEQCSLSHAMRQGQWTKVEGEPCQLFYKSKPVATDVAKLFQVPVPAALDFSLSETGPQYDSDCGVIDSVITRSQVLTVSGTHGDSTYDDETLVETKKFHKCVEERQYVRWDREQRKSIYKTVKRIGRSREGEHYFIGYRGYEILAFTSSDKKAVVLTSMSPTNVIYEAASVSDSTYANIIQMIDNKETNLKHVALVEYSRDFRRIRTNALPVVLMYSVSRSVGQYLQLFQHSHMQGDVPKFLEYAVTHKMCNPMWASGPQNLVQLALNLDGLLPAVKSLEKDLLKCQVLLDGFSTTGVSFPLVDVDAVCSEVELKVWKFLERQGRCAEQGRLMITDVVSGESTGLVADVVARAKERLSIARSV